MFFDDIGSWVSGAAGTVSGGIVDTANSVGTFTKDFGNGVVTGFTSVFVGIGDGVSSVFNAGVGLLNKGLDTVGGLTDILPYLAIGGAIIGVVILLKKE
jgi:hypothetical protein